MTTEAATLRRITAAGPWRGVVGLTGAETRRWLPWRALGLIVASVAVMALVFAIWWFAGSQNEANYRLGSLMYPFFALWGIVLTVTTAAAAQGAVAGEVDDGTAAWLIGMPVGRPAFVVSKVLGAVPGVAATVFGAGFIAYPVLSFAASKEIIDFTGADLFYAVQSTVLSDGFAALPAFGEYLGLLLRLTLFLLVLVALMVLLGTLFRAQAIVLGLGLVLAIGLFVAGLLDLPGIVDATPAGLIAGVLAAIQSDPAPLAAPLLVSLGWIAVATLLAVARFQRREL
jgi:ABC-type transport system involved in multi-copper enzyme maturation permease subunit